MFVAHLHFSEPLPDTNAFYRSFQVKTDIKILFVFVFFDCKHILSAFHLALLQEQIQCDWDN